MSNIFDLFGFSFEKPKEVRPVLTVDLASDIPAEAFIRALQSAGLTIKEQDKRGRLMICKAEPRRPAIDYAREPEGLVWGKKPRRKREIRGN